MSKSSDVLGKRNMTPKDVMGKRNVDGVIDGKPQAIEPTFKESVLINTDKLGVTQGGSLTGFLWGLAVGVIIVWQWSNITKIGNSLFKK